MQITKDNEFSKHKYKPTRTYSASIKKNYEHLKHISIITQQEMQDKDFLELMRRQKQFEEFDRGAIRFSQSCLATGSYFNVTKNKKKQAILQGWNCRNAQQQEEREKHVVYNNKLAKSFTNSPKEFTIILSQHELGFSYSPKSILKNPSAKKIELPLKLKGMYHLGTYQEIIIFDIKQKSLFQYNEILNIFCFQNNFNFVNLRYNAIILNLLQFVLVLKF